MTETPGKKIAFNFVSVGIGLLLIGAMFKIQHWPFATGILTAGYATIGIFSVVRIAKIPNKHVLDILRMLFVVVWCVASVLGLFHLFNYKVVDAVSQVGFIGWITTEGVYFVRSKTKQPNALLDDISHLDDEEPQEQYKPWQIWLSNGMFVVSGLLIIVGLLFRFQHLPGASPLIIAGLTLGAIRYLAGFVMR